MAAQRSLSTRIARVAVLVILALAVLVALVPLALRTDWARQRIVRAINNGLAQSFQGKLVVEDIGAIDFGGVNGIDLRAMDPSGRRVIEARGVSASVFLPGVAWTALFDATPRIVLRSVHIDHVDVRLRPDADAGVTLADIFEPRARYVTPSRAASGLTLAIPEIVVRHIWVHGQMSGSPWLDAELASTRAKLLLSPAGFELTLRHSQLTTRGLPLAANPSGTIEGELRLRKGVPEPLELAVGLEGTMAESPLSFDGSLRGGEVNARVRLASVPASWLSQQLPGLKLEDSVQLSVEVDGRLPALDFRVAAHSRALDARATGYAFVSGGLEAVSQLDVTDLDLSRVRSDAPHTDLDFSLRAELFERGQGEYEGAYGLEVATGALGSVATPATWIGGRLALGNATGVRSTGKLRIEEPGAPTAGRYALKLRSPDARIEVELSSQLDEPARLVSITGARALGALDLRAIFEPQSGNVSLSTDLRLSALERGELRVTELVASARATSTLGAPRLQAVAHATLMGGRARASFAYDDSEQTLVLTAHGVNVPSLAGALGLPVAVHSGVLELDTSIHRQHGHLSGTLGASVAWLGIENLRDAEVRAHGTLANDRVDGTLDLVLGKLGSVQVVASHLLVPNDVSDPRELERVRGQVSASGRLNLAELSPLLARSGIPIERASGRLRFEAGLRGPSHGFGPELALLVTTNGLRVVGRRRSVRDPETTTAAIEQQPFALEGIDAHFSTHVRPKRGEAFGTLILRDRGGTLGEAQFEVQLPRWATDLSRPEVLYRVPLKVRLETASRELSSLPALLRPAQIRGRLQAALRLDGSLSDPHVHVDASASRIRRGRSAEPVDLKAVLEVTHGSGGFHIRANGSRGGAALADVAVRWRGDARRLAAQLGRGLSADESGLQAEASANLSDLPLELVPGLADREIGGHVSGFARLEHWGKDAQLEARVTSSGVHIGKVGVQRLELAARAVRGRLAGTLDIESGSGSSRVTVDTDMHWGSRAVPQLGDRGVVEATARDFSLETLKPLVTQSVSDMSGRLDAQARVELTPGATVLQGRATLSQGALQVPSIGQRLSGIDADVSVDGDQVVLDRLEARGTTGRLSAHGRARLDGFNVNSADAELRISQDQVIPITVQGVAIGDAWGALRVAYRDVPGRRSLTVTVPQFHLRTPDLDPQGLQSLEDAEDVQIGYRRADGTFVTLPQQPLDEGGQPSGSKAGPPTIVHVALGSDIVVERDDTARVKLAGQLDVVVADQPRVTGRIELEGGQIDVQGKLFEIERGVVTFEGGDGTNPTIVATARWDAPEYTVYAEYAGTVENGHLRLHSEPPLSQDELTTLLLFGSPEGSLGAQGGSGATALAAAAAGGPATKGLNRALSHLTNLDVTTRIDTSTGSARPELVLRLSPRLSAKITRSIGQPSAGESPDRTFLTLELRLRRSWALSALLGDRGASALDLIWRKRY